tara:strand:- start:2707 stop:3363 length:657 start_codon:yes stop_codon:yes gene_type:complete
MTKSNQGFSVTKTATAKTSITKYASHESTTNKRSVDAWYKWDNKTETYVMGPAFKACIDYALVGKVKKDASGKPKVYLSKDDKKRCGVHKLIEQGHKPNDLTCMTKIGLYHMVDKDGCENAILNAVKDGIPRKPQGMFKAIDPDASTKRASNTGDIDKWIAGVIASAVKRGLSNDQLIAKIVTACGGQATFSTKPQGTTNVNEILKPSTFENKKRSKK